MPLPCRALDRDTDILADCLEGCHVDGPLQFCFTCSWLADGEGKHKAMMSLCAGQF